MKNQLGKFVLLSLFALAACTSGFEKKLESHWQVTKMEKAVNVTSNQQTLIEVEVDPNMSYHFMPNHKVELITQMGSQLAGTWSVADSTITINVQGETRQFAVKELTEERLVMVTDRFKLRLVRKE